MDKGERKVKNTKNKIFTIVFTILYSTNAFSWGISIPTPGEIVEKVKQTFNDATKTVTKAASDTANEVRKKATGYVERTVDNFLNPGESVDNIIKDLEKISRQPDNLASVFTLDRVASLINLFNSLSTQTPLKLDQSIFIIEDYLLKTLVTSSDQDPYKLNQYTRANDDRSKIENSIKVLDEAIKKMEYDLYVSSSVLLPSYKKILQKVIEISLARNDLNDVGMDSTISSPDTDELLDLHERFKSLPTTISKDDKRTFLLLSEFVLRLPSLASKYNMNCSQIFENYFKRVEIQSLPRYVDAFTNSVNFMTEYIIELNSKIVEIKAEKAEQEKKLEALK